MEKKRRMQNISLRYYKFSVECFLKMYKREKILYFRHNFRDDDKKAKKSAETVKKVIHTNVSYKICGFNKKLK